MTASQQRITEILAAVAAGDRSAPDQLWRLVYDELHHIAQAQMAQEAPGRTLQPTALVHEAYMRLFGPTDTSFNNRRHFFSAAARVMRQIRVDDARMRNRAKRGSGERPAELISEPATFDQDPAETLAIHEVLERLEERDSQKADLVNMRYFAGMSIDECASAMGVSKRTVSNQWQLARAWLYRELSERPPRPHDS